MSATGTDLEARLAQFVEQHVLHGVRLPLEPLCADRPELLAPLRALVDQYLSVTSSLTGDVEDPRSGAAGLPAFDGFQTIERLGAGGMGEVYKLKDLTLDRIVAGKIVRHGRLISWAPGSSGDQAFRAGEAINSFSWICSPPPYVLKGSLLGCNPTAEEPSSRWPCPSW
jgi:hypothetical protein